MLRRTRYRWTCLFLGMCVAVAVCGCRPARQPKRAVTRPETGYMFPELDAIESIQIRASDVLGDLRTPESILDLPKTAWGRVLQLMTPSERDVRPCKWVYLAEIRIKTKKGATHAISVFETDEPLGAFAAGPDLYHVTYFRGGNSVQFREVVPSLREEIKRRREREREKGVGSL
jgi:hypothetical protein